MILCLDVGNTQVHGGVFDGDQLKMQFRRTSQYRGSSDEIGVFLRSVLKENDVDPTAIRQIGICSVVPDAVHSIRNACLKYFDINPFLLQAGVKTGLKIRYRNPLEVGADRIANAMAAVQLFPNENLIIVDFGTATTFCAVTADKDYLGGSILAGLRISVEALETRTAKLPSIEIIAAKEALGRSTVESMQSGLYFGQIGLVKELRDRIRDEAFKGSPVRVIGTGGFSSLFDKAGLFDNIVPDLVLKGLIVALKLNGPFEKGVNNEINFSKM